VLLGEETFISDEREREREKKKKKRRDSGRMVERSKRFGG